MANKTKDNNLSPKNGNKPARKSKHLMLAEKNPHLILESFDENLERIKASNGPTAMVIRMTDYFVEIGDAIVMGKGLERAGFEVFQTSTRELGKNKDKLEDIPVEKMDAILIQPPFTALFQTAGGRKDALVNVLDRAKDSARALYVCDTTMYLKPWMWNAKEGVASKVNVFGKYPFKVLGSFTDDILKSEEGLKKADSMWLNKMHQDTEFIPLQWSIFHGATISSEMDLWTKCAEENLEKNFPDGVPKVKNFYYGFKKSHVARSLESMGIYEDPDNAVFGGIVDFLKNGDIQNLSGFCNGEMTPETWIPIAQEADKIYVPYDPIKSEFQVTKRYAEMAYLGFGDKLIVDPRVNKDLINLTKSLDLWKPEMDAEAEKIKTIFRG